VLLETSINDQFADVKVGSDRMVTGNTTNAFAMVVPAKAPVPMITLELMAEFIP
jgi:hypothetical protein